MRKKILIICAIASVTLLSACGSPKQQTTNRPVTPTNSTKQTQAATKANTIDDISDTTAPLVGPEITTEPVNSFYEINSFYGLSVDNGTPTPEQIEEARKANMLVREKVGEVINNAFDMMDIDHDGTYEYLIKIKGKGITNVEHYIDFYNYVEDENGNGSLVSVTNTELGIENIYFDRNRTLFVAEYTDANDFILKRYRFIDAYGDDTKVPPLYNGQTEILFTRDGFKVPNGDGTYSLYPHKTAEADEINNLIYELSREWYEPSFNHLGTKQNFDIYLPIDDEMIINMWDTICKWNN